MLIATLLVVATYPQVSLPAHTEGGIVPLDFMKSFVPTMWWVFFPFVHLFWSLLYTTLRVLQEQIATFEELWAGIKSRRLIDVEAVLLLAIAGMAPGMIIHIDGGSAFYFSDVQRWFSLALVLAMAPVAVFQWSRTGGARKALFAVFAIPFVLTMAANSVYWTKRFLQANAATRMSLYPASAATSIPAGIHGLSRLASAQTLRAGLQSSRNYRVLEGLKGLSSMPRSERRRTALFIPQSEKRYWEILQRPGACSFSSFVAPSLSTMAMIDGMPPFGCTLSQFYGLKQYTPRTRLQTGADASVQNVCSKATATAFDRVMFLHFDSTGLMSKTVADCNAVVHPGSGPL